MLDTINDQRFKSIAELFTRIKAQLQLYINPLIKVKVQSFQFYLPQF